MLWFKFQHHCYAYNHVIYYYGLIHNVCFDSMHVPLKMGDLIEKMF